MGTVLKTIVAIALLTVFAGLIFIYSGAYDVAATSPDSGLTKWALSTAREHSIENRAEAVTLPDATLMSDPKTLQIGFNHYNEMCVTCHGAPGMDAGEGREGLNPKPPLLAEVADKISSKEMFWVIKNGIKMTGMPAWGPTHSDDKIWAMVAFVKALPKISAAQYKEMAKHAMPDDDDDHAHSHSH